MKKQHKGGNNNNVDSSNAGERNPDKELHVKPEAQPKARGIGAGTNSGPRPMQVHYIVVVIWILLSLAAGYWAGKFGFALPPEYAPKEEAAIRSFIQGYFKTWSAKDLEGYGACFQEDATIAYVDEINPVVLDRATFLESQKKAHERALAPMTEAPESVSVQIHGGVAHVQVRWLLKKAEGEERGWDFFTLVRVNGAWKIIHLSFFNDPAPAWR